MKKILSLMLAVAMVLCMSFMVVPAQQTLAAGVGGKVTVKGSESGEGRIGEAVAVVVTAPRHGLGEEYDVTLEVDKSGLIDALSPATGTLLEGSSLSSTFTPQAAGTVKITATFECTSHPEIKTTTASAKYRIYEPEISVSPKEITWPNKTATATVTNEAVNASGQFTISPSGTIDDYGNIQVDGAGEYTVTYTDAVNASVSVSCHFSVKKGTPSLSIQDVIEIHVGDMIGVPFSRSGIPADKVSTIQLEPGDSAVADVEFQNSDPASGRLWIHGVDPGTTYATLSFPKDTDLGNWNYTTTRIKIKVVDQNTPILTLSPTSMKLAKGDAKALSIMVDNAATNNVLLKVTGKQSNAYRGLAIDGYTSKNGVYVNVTGSNSVVLTPKYNGTYYVTASLNGAESETCTVVVTGCSTLPQTGPDFTMVYVFAGLLLASVAALVIVNIKRKKVSQ